MALTYPYLPLPILPLAVAALDTSCPEPAQPTQIPWGWSLAAKCTSTLLLSISLQLLGMSSAEDLLFASCYLALSSRCGPPAVLSTDPSPCLDTWSHPFRAFPTDWG